MIKIKDFIKPVVVTAIGVALNILTKLWNLNFQIAFIGLILIIAGFYLFIDPIFGLRHSAYEDFKLNLHKCRYCGHEYGLTGEDTLICPVCLKKDPEYEKPVDHSDEIIVISQ